LEVFVGLVLGNYVEELLLLAVEGGGEPVGHGAADAVLGMATGDIVFEGNAVALESKSGRLPPIFLREPRTAPYCFLGRAGVEPFCF